MIINFAYNKKIINAWDSVEFIPRVGESVFIDGTTYVVEKVLWISKDWIDIDIKK